MKIPSWKIFVYTICILVYGMLGGLFIPSFLVFVTTLPFTDPLKLVVLIGVSLIYVFILIIVFFKTLEWYDERG